MMNDLLAWIWEESIINFYEAWLSKNDDSGIRTVTKGWIDHFFKFLDLFKLYFKNR